MAEEQEVQEQEQEQKQEQSDLRDELEAAYDAADETTEETAPASVETAPAAEPTAAEESAPVEETEEQAPMAAVDTTADVESDSTEQEEKELAAPGSWKPNAREEWKNIPRHVQEEIHRRERDMAMGIQNNSEAANFGSQMQEALAPYQSVIAMEGTDPVSAMRNLAGTAATLRMGTDEQKAQVVSNIIKAYGVDINTLDNLLVGEPVMPPEQQQLMQAIDQRLAPVQEFMNAAQQAQMQYAYQADAEITNDINTFAADPKNEFFEDVRPIMADILDTAANRGQQMGLEEAYNLACQMTPEIKQVLEQRQTAQQVADNQAALEAKAAAASSLPSSTPQTGTSAQPPGEDLRSTLEGAWDALQPGVAGQRI